MGRIIVIGGANADIKGRAREALLPGTSIPGDVTVSAGGVGRNIAENLARLGEDVSLITMTGEDAHGAMVRQASTEAGVDLSLAAVSPAPTGVYLAVLDGEGEMVTAINDMRAADAMTVAHIASHEAALLAADLLVADCNIPVDCLSWICGFAAANSKRLLIEPISAAKARKLLMFRRDKPVHVITPNRMQLEALTGFADAGEGLPALHRLGFANIAMHAGKDGVTVSDGVQAGTVAAFASGEIADVTGAGDAAAAGLACGIVAGLSLMQAARVGQAAAALKLRSSASVTREMTRDRVRDLAGIAF